MSYKLPENWYLEVNPSNFEMVRKWRAKVKGFNTTTPGNKYLTESGIIYPAVPEKTTLDGSELSPKRVRILTHTFERYVVGKTINDNINDYKYLIKLFKKLKIK